MALVSKYPEKLLEGLKVFEGCLKVFEGYLRGTNVFGGHLLVFCCIVEPLNFLIGDFLLG